MRVRGRVRRVGNSLGVVIPKDEAERHNLAEGDLVELEVERRINLEEMFGSLKFSKSTQQMKEESRAGWGD
ncbi:MAG: AbrB/MazE/SpoVT family DNA-binding domain-containing protein [Thaumarchaeota archaeon]|nr:AbrB/MazE/SpoVT family DNA-binding domain-containing protein [Nitrososphaerota archaeon]